MDQPQSPVESHDFQYFQELLTFLSAESNASIWRVDLVRMQGTPLTTYPFLGYTQEEIPNALDAWLTLIHPGDLADVHQQIAEIAAGTRSRIEVEHRVRHHDGTWRWLRTSAVAIERDATGNPIVMQGVCVEITHPRHSERLLRMCRDALTQFGQAKTLSELLEGLVVAVQQQTEDAVAAVLLRQQDSGNLEIAAGQDLPLPMRQRLSTFLHTACTEPCGASLTDGDSFVGRIDQSPWCSACQSAAIAGGLSGCATASIVDSTGKNLGVFLLFFVHPRSASREEHELLLASAQLAAVATEHWRNTALLKRSEERLERAMWGAELGLWDADFQTGEVYFSEYWNRILGYSPGEVSTKLQDLLNLVHPDDHSSLTKAFQDHAEGRTPHFESEHRLRAKDGRWVWICDRARIVERDSTGKPLRVAGTQFEITARKQIELELRRSEARFQAFMEHLPAIAFIKDRQGHYLFANPAWAAQFLPSVPNPSPNQLYGKTDEDLWPSDIAERIRKEDSDVINTGVPFRTNEWGVDTNGDNRFWLVRKFLIPESADPLVGGFALEVTQQRLAEKALRESEERFRKLAETARVVPWEWSYEGRHYTYVGPQVELIFGYTQQEWTAPGFWEANSNPEDREATLSHSRSQVLEGDHYEVEYRFRHKSGEWRWVHDVVIVCRNNGKPECLRGFMIDVTKQRQTEAALRQSESRLRSVTEHAPDVIMQVDREGRVQFISRVIPPYAKSDVVGTLVEDWLPPEGKKACHDAIQEVFNTGKSGGYVTRFDHPTDGHLWFNCNVAPVIVDGKVESAILISRDFTTEKKTEIAMRESEQRYRLLADHSSDMIVRLSPDGRFAYCSPATEHITGYAPSELIGEKFDHLVTPDEVPRLYQEISQVIQEQRPHVVTYRMVRKDGHVVWAESKGQPVLDAESNQVTELIVNTRDVTDRIEATRKLCERDHHLAHAERLATMGQMASELAHEINQPLYAIANFADACQSALDKNIPDSLEDLKGWLSQIAHQARRASDIVRRINHFVRKGDAEWTTCQLNDCVRDVIPLFEINARRDGIQLELDLQPDLPTVLAERLLMEQVLTNLIRNGLEAIREAKPAKKRLMVHTRFIPNQGVYVAVIDNGTGIPQDRFEHLFEPYFTSKEDGTGMGLSICRTTIEEHDGRIWATNNQSSGATFQFLIPANSTQSLPPE